MTTISISQLKTNPASAIRASEDYPVAVENRNKIQAYMIGKKLYETLIDALEDRLDRAVIESADFTKGDKFEDVAKSLGI